MTITQAQSRARLRQDIATSERAVEDLVKVDLNDNQFAALVSFTFNVGVTAFRGSTLLKKLTPASSHAGTGQSGQGHGRADAQAGR